MSTVFELGRLAARMQIKTALDGALPGATLRKQPTWKMPPALLKIPAAPPNGQNNTEPWIDALKRLRSTPGYPRAWPFQGVNKSNAARLINPFSQERLSTPVGPGSYMKSLELMAPLVPPKREPEKDLLQGGVGGAGGL